MLQAMILSLAVAAAALGLTGCVTEQRNSNPLTVDMDCGLLPITVTSSGEQTQVVAGDLDLKLTRVVTASGAKYQQPGDEQTWFWHKGDGGTLQIAGRSWPECVRRGNLPSPLEVRGNEPFWHIELSQDNLTLRTPEIQAAESTTFEAHPISDGGHRISASVDGRELILDIHPRLCSDSMTGMPYPYRAELLLDQAVAQGCAGAAETLLQGAEWSVTALDGDAVPDDAQGTIEFFHDGLVAGVGFCNRYSGQHEISGEGLSIGPLISTRMACPEPAMSLENHLLRRLQRVHRFEIGDSGQLRLHTSEGGSIEARLSSQSARLP